MVHFDKTRQFSLYRFLLISKSLGSDPIYTFLCAVTSFETRVTDCSYLQRNVNTWYWWILALAVISTHFTKLILTSLMVFIPLETVN